MLQKNSICRHGSPSTFCSYTPFSYKVYALKLWFFGEKKLFRFIFLNNLQSASSRTDSGKREMIFLIILLTDKGSVTVNKMENGLVLLI